MNRSSLLNRGSSDCASGFQSAVIEGERSGLCLVLVSSKRRESERVGWGIVRGGD